MSCDVRTMHPDDVGPLWKKVREYMPEADYRLDDGDGYWFVSIERRGWKFHAIARGRAVTHDIRISYYPPNGGRIRFDGQVPRVVPYEGLADSTILQEFNKCLVQYGHLGKNRLSHFEQFDTKEEPVKLSWWRRIFGYPYL